MTVERESTTYELVRGEPLTVRHERDDVELSTEGPVTRSNTPRPEPPMPTQPETRAPGRGTLPDDSSPGTPASAGSFLRRTRRVDPEDASVGD